MMLPEEIDGVTYSASTGEILTVTVGLCRINLKALVVTDIVSRKKSKISKTDAEKFARKARRWLKS